MEFVFLMNIKVLASKKKILNILKLHIIHVATKTKIVIAKATFVNNAYCILHNA